MRKSRILKDVKIEKLGYGGVGIGTHKDGRKILVTGALPNSVVDCKVIKRKKEYISAHITEVKEIDTTLLDGEVVCPHYLFSYSSGSHQDTPVHKQGCGGCKWQAISYENQCRMKKDIVADCFQQVFREYGVVTVSDVIPSPLVYGYRNKIEFSFGKFLKKASDEGSSDRIKSFEVAEHRTMGFHRQGQFSKVVDVDTCYLISQRMHEVYRFLKHELQSSGLPVYDAKAHEGLLRHCVIREGVHTGQIMVIISLATKYFTDHQKEKRIRERLLEKRKKDQTIQDSITTLCIAENDGLADAVRAPGVSLYTIRGEGRIFETLSSDENAAHPITFQISPFSFFQTNTLGAQKLFYEAFKRLGQIEGNILDLYCGSGTIGLLALHQGFGKKLLGIEIVESAIYDAQTNASINGLSERCQFLVGKAEKVIDQSGYESFLTGDDLLIVDPPRNGLHTDVVEFLRDRMRYTSGKFLYISCNPVTMARDVSLLLKDKRCRLKELIPVDLFPHTHHIETIGIFDY